ncbi:MAG: hypothetical protein V6008_00465 [Candidatus Dasytiphilus stammeri]
MKSSIGHIRDLPTRGTLKSNQSQIKPDTRALIISIVWALIDPWHGWQANYPILPLKIKGVSELQCILYLVPIPLSLLSPEGIQVGDKYLPAIPNFYALQYISPEAHEAIRPSEAASG